MTGGKKKDWGIIVSCFIGAAEWWFLSSPPSFSALIIASVLLTFVTLAFCLLAVLLPEQEAPHRSESFVPLHSSETYGPKALLS